MYTFFVALINVSNLSSVQHFNTAKQTARLDMFVKSRILILFNLVSATELLEEYEEVIRDVKEEMQQFGEVQDVIGADERIFVCFQTEKMAENAEKLVAGRMFNHRMIVTGFLCEADWTNKRFDFAIDVDEAEGGEEQPPA